MAQSKGKRRPSEGDADLQFWSTARTECSICSHPFNPRIVPWGEAFVTHWNDTHAGYPLVRARDLARIWMPYGVLRNDRNFKYLSSLCMVQGCDRYHLPYVQTSPEGAAELLENHMFDRHTCSLKRQPTVPGSQPVPSRRRRGRRGGLNFIPMAAGSVSAPAQAGTAPQQDPLNEQRNEHTRASSRTKSPNHDIEELAFLVAHHTLPAGSSSSKPKVSMTSFRLTSQSWHSVTCPGCEMSFEPRCNGADGQPSHINVLTSLHAFVNHWNDSHVDRWIRLKEPARPLHRVSFIGHNQRSRRLAIAAHSYDPSLFELLAGDTEKLIQCEMQFWGLIPSIMPVEAIRSYSPPADSESKRRNHTPAPRQSNAELQRMQREPQVRPVTSAEFAKMPDYQGSSSSSHISGVAETRTARTSASPSRASGAPQGRNKSPLAHPQHSADNLATARLRYQTAQNASPQRVPELPPKARSSIVRPSSATASAPGTQTFPEFQHLQHAVGIQPQPAAASQAGGNSLHWLQEGRTTPPQAAAAAQLEPMRNSRNTSAPQTQRQAIRSPFPPPPPRQSTPQQHQQTISKEPSHVTYEDGLLWRMSPAPPASSSAAPATVMPTTVASGFSPVSQNPRSLPRQSRIPSPVTVAGGPPAVSPILPPGSHPPHPHRQQSRRLTMTPSVSAAGRPMSVASARMPELRGHRNTARYSNSSRSDYSEPPADSHQAQSRSKGGIFWRRRAAQNAGKRSASPSSEPEPERFSLPRFDGPNADRLYPGLGAKLLTNRHPGFLQRRPKYGYEKVSNPRSRPPRGVGNRSRFRVPEGHYVDAYGHSTYI